MPVVVLSVVVAAVLARVRPEAHKRLGWFGTVTLATFVSLGWTAWFVTGQWTTAWATVFEATALYLVSGLLAYGLVHTGVIAWLRSRLGRLLS